MPYIEPGKRNEIYPMCSTPATPGELNFQLTELIKCYWSRKGNYQGINDILGALEGAKLEFYRRVAVPYEDKKIEENGDLY